MKSSPLFWWGLAAFFFLVLGVWLGLIQSLGGWLFHLITWGH